MYNFKNPVNSYWENTKPDVNFIQTTIKSDIKSDIVVIGGGYTGLSCALQLSKKFGFEVSLVEAGIKIGYGSSARNAGFLCMGPTKLSTNQLIKKYGLDEVKRYYKDQVDGSNFTVQLAKEYNINCDIVGNLNFEVAHHPSFFDSMKEDSNNLTKYFGIKTKSYTKEEFNSIGHTGSEQYGAVSYEPGCALNPLKFLLGIAKACYDNKVKLFSNSKVLKVEKTQNGYLVITKMGNILCKKIVFAVNGFYQDNFLPQFKNRILPAISNIIVTKKLSNDELKMHNFLTLNPILNARNLLFYYRLLPDNRILFGARGDLNGSKESSLKMSYWIEKRFKEIFPLWKNVAIDYRWSGFVAITRDLTPSVGKLSDDEIYHSFGYCANGVNTAPFLGKELANLIGGSNIKEMRISKIYQGLPKKFPFPFLRLLYLRIAYIYYSIVDK
tara:strand:- start:19242 stop:20561 length:1320 start_codon:yes stop_codon:yes gene_type:complete